MGWKNVDRALTAHVEPVAAKMLLCHMARAAHDNTGRYYGGIDWLVLRMDLASTNHGRRRIFRLLSVLIDAGYVKPDGMERGRRVYVLTLPDGLGNGAPPPPESTAGA